jgi:hypothetical protein
MPKKTSFQIPKNIFINYKTILQSVNLNSDSSLQIQHMNDAEITYFIIALQVLTGIK